MNDFNAILKSITGKSMEDVVDDMLSGKPEAQQLREISEHIKAEQDRTDVIKQGCEDLLKRG